MNSELLYKDDICPVCASSEIHIEPTNLKDFVDTFYLEAVREELNISLLDLKNELKVYECDTCATIFCNPWFSAQTSFNIYNQIYGQHNRGWDALYAWVKGKEVQNYWPIIDVARDLLGRELRSYAEYHCPFQGNLFKFRSQELPGDKTSSFYKHSRNSITASAPGRVVSSNVRLKSWLIKFSRRSSRKHLDKLDQYVTPIEIKRFLAVEASTRFWNSSCISSGVNCTSLASKLLDVSVLRFPDFLHQKQKIDVFAFINTLDHSHDPMKLLAQALEFSKVVFLINHTQKVITKQHKFLFQPGFIDYLKKNMGWNVRDIGSSTTCSSTEICEDRIMLMITKT